MSNYRYRVPNYDNPSNQRMGFGRPTKPEGFIKESFSLVIHLALAVGFLMGIPLTILFLIFYPIPTIGVLLVIGLFLFVLSKKTESEKARNHRETNEMVEAVRTFNKTA